CDIDRETLQMHVARLQGDFQWPVPIFSAAKVEGKKLYEYGRAGEEIELPIKTMSFWGAEIEESTSNTVQLHMSCSKGSFVRTWASKLGEALGSGGMIEALRRTRVGGFSIVDALTLEDLEQRVGDLGPAFVPMSHALPSWKALIAAPREARLVANG